MAATNYWYTDVATNQQQGNNIPGQVGVQNIANTDGGPEQNNPMFEGPIDLVATYVWTGNEAQYDTINIGIGRAGMLISPKVTVASGTTAPATTLTVAIGDNDLGLISSLPIPNAASNSAALGGGNSLQAPVWVAATSYVAGNVVLDAASSPSNMTYTCILAVSGSTAPHSDSTHWIANYQRYSASIDIHAANGNVSASGGTQLYGGVPSKVPESVLPGSVQTGWNTSQLLGQQYILQYDCWIQALILTINTPVANTISVFRIPTGSLN